MSTGPMPPCEIKFEYTQADGLQITYSFEGHLPTFTTNFDGAWPKPQDFQEVWAVVNDPKEIEALRLVKDEFYVE